MVDQEPTVVVRVIFPSSCAGVEDEAKASLYGSFLSLKIFTYRITQSFDRGNFDVSS